MAAGGIKDPAHKRNNSKNYVGNAMDLAKKNGYKVVTQKDEFMALTPADGKILAYNDWLQDSGALPYAMDTRDQDISIAEFTAKGIELLNNDKGFFLMVEGGKIDWACHANDGTASIYDTLAFDAAVKEAVDFAKKHPDETLIVVSGDHECGGLTLGFAGTKYSTNFKVLGSQKVSFQKFTDEIMKGFTKESGKTFDDIKPLITEHFGLKFQGADDDAMVLKEHEINNLSAAYDRSVAGEKEKSKNPETYLLYGEYDPLTVTLTHILNQKAGMAWTSYKHTGVPVATSAMGVKADIFNGYYDNTDVALKMMSIMGFGDKPQYASTDEDNLMAATAN